MLLSTNDFVLVISLVLLLVLVLVAMRFVLFINWLRCYRNQPINISNPQLPRAAIVLSVRGADPALSDCIKSLTRQDYPDYTVQIVVDSEVDPAWKVVNRIVRDIDAHQHVKVSALTHRYDTCSLKCSALVQAVSELDRSYDVIAFADADTIAYPSWLREMVNPLVANEGIGLTSGIRWYMPTDRSMGSLVRHIWGVFCAIGMLMYGIPWGGSMAMRRCLFDEGGLLETWKKVLSDDTTAGAAARRIGLKVQYVPRVIAINQEQCNLAGCWRFVRRQYTWGRFYNPSWKLMVVEVFFVKLLPLLSVFLLPIVWMNGNFALLKFLLFEQVSFLALMFFAIIFSNRAITSITTSRNESYHMSYTMEVLTKMVIGFPVAIIFSFLASIVTIPITQVEWRGVTYKVQDPLNVRMIEYSPYQESYAFSGETSGNSIV
jgi:cellulose synthase/poly-beta-1,6-N-acetylglucosamine synthase-like glycosyltransferase